MPTDQSTPPTEPGEPIAAGEGWRLLDPKEPTIRGDEVRPNNPSVPQVDRWRESVNWRDYNGKQSPEHIYRRHIEQPAPEEMCDEEDAKFFNSFLPASGIEAEVCADTRAAIEEICGMVLDPWDVPYSLKRHLRRQLRLVHLCEQLRMAVGKP